MSNDLISRQAVLSVLEEIFSRYKTLWKDYRFGTEVLQAIKELPTAFDKESVIKELEEQRYKSDDAMCAETQEERIYHAGKYVAYDDAVGVVMKGGL